MTKSQIKKLLNKKVKSDCLDFLKIIPDDYVDLIIFDPQYGSGVSAGSRPAKSSNQLEQKRLKNAKKFKSMSNFFIGLNLFELERTLKPSGYFLWWMNKHFLLFDVQFMLLKSNIGVVDLLVWENQRFGMGSRTRRASEYLLILQKQPIKIAKWKDHSIKDVWSEKSPTKKHYHKKPFELTKTLIECTTDEQDIVLDICAGSFESLEICQSVNRNFLGCDLEVEDDLQTKLKDV